MPNGVRLVLPTIPSGVRFNDYRSASNRSNEASLLTDRDSLNPVAKQRKFSMTYVNVESQKIVKLLVNK